MEDAVVRVRYAGSEREVELVDGRLDVKGDPPASGLEEAPVHDDASAHHEASAHDEASPQDEARFLALFNYLYATRPHLFGPVEPTRRKPQEVTA